MKYLLVLASVALVCVAGDEAETSSRAGGLDRSLPDLLKRNEVVVATLRDVYSSLAQQLKHTNEEPAKKNFAFLAAFYNVYLNRPEVGVPLPYTYLHEIALNVTLKKHLYEPAYLNAAPALLFLDALRVHTRKRSAAIQRLCYNTTSNQECEDRLKEFDLDEQLTCRYHNQHVELHKYVLENVYKFEAFADDALNSKKEKFEDLPQYLRDLRDRPTQKLVLTSLFPKLYRLLVTDPLLCPYGHYERNVYLQSVP